MGPASNGLGTQWFGARAASSGAAGFRVAMTALVIAVAYWVGANFGFLLQLPPTTPSILWPPNSILTATFLLTPPRRWGLYALAALPAHLIVALSAGMPTALVLGWFVTNCSEALIGAVCVRALSDAPTRFDTLRRVLGFVAGAGIFAPFASSFLDAALVTAVLGEPYALVWRTRFFSNVLTELTLVPAIVITITSGAAWIRGASLRRGLEVALLALGLAAICFMYVAWGIPPSPHLPVVFFLPVVLLAAVRFGPAGASLSQLSTTLVAIWVAAHEAGWRTGPATADRVLALQLTLSLSAIPLLCLAGVIQERWRTQQALAERLSFEEWLSRLSGSFVHLPSHQMDDAFGTWLGRLGQLLRVDRVLLLRLADNGAQFAIEHSWAAPGLRPMARGAVSGDFPWTAERLLREQPMALARPDELPAEAGRDWASLQQYGIKSKLALPLVSHGRVFGGLVLEAVAEQRTWPPELLGRLQLVAEVFANALARKETEDELRASELMKSAILASLNSSVGLLDREGTVIAVNADWERFAPHRAVGLRGGVGANYLEVCHRMAGDGIPLMAQAAAGVETVLDGSRAAYALEYSWATPAGERWYLMSVVPLNRADGGGVVSHTDVTERKRAELEAQRSRQELAHFARVSTMGELTASLAHELNQPLAGILTNAQAARRFLDLSPLDVQELRSILDDIIEDDKRAAEVIQRLRDLLRKGEFKLAALDLNLLIRDVVKLLGSDTVIRNVGVVLELDKRTTVVSGDRVQLQQVVLNLLLNAMEAVADAPVAARKVLVRTAHDASHGVEVVVVDSGPGLREGTERQVFEPFFTTKAAGMGMGLAIARSIIEAHGGTIWAENKRPRGAVFGFRLPLDAEEGS